MPGTEHYAHTSRMEWQRAYSLLRRGPHASRTGEANARRQTSHYSPQVASFLMCDWEGCTTGTIRPPNLNQRRVGKMSGFAHPYYICRYTAGGLRERILGLGG
jgi:hypothetical protein